MTDEKSSEHSRLSCGYHTCLLTSPRAFEGLLCSMMVGLHMKGIHSLAGKWFTISRNWLALVGPVSARSASPQDNKASKMQNRKIWSIKLFTPPYKIKPFSVWPLRSLQMLWPEHSPYCYNPPFLIRILFVNKISPYLCPDVLIWYQED